MTVQHAAEFLALFAATFPFIYYLLAIYSSIRLFANRPKPNPDFTPPVSILKPVRGLDEGAFENFASFCRQNYPEYELLFCLGSNDDPNVPVIEKLAREFPARSIRILIGSSQKATNDKVSKLSRLASEAKYPWLVFSDSDIRVEPDYLRTVMGPFRDERVGAVTCLYLQIDEKSFANNLQTIGQVSDFYASLGVARLLDGVKFALGSTIAISKKVLAECGLFAAIENKPADDMLVGRMVSEKGYQVELLPYAVRAVADFESFRGFLAKRMRWAVVQKNMRPLGAFRTAPDARPPLVARGHRRAPDGRYRGHLSGIVRLPAFPDDLDHLRVGNEAALNRKKILAHPCLGRSRRCDSLRQLRPKPRPLARRRLHNSEWDPHSCFDDRNPESQTPRGEKRLAAHAARDRPLPHIPSSGLS
jgi:ceramide glucosyltransferase